MKRVIGFGEQGMHTEIVNGDLEEWFKTMNNDNPDYDIIVKNSQYIW